MFRSIIFVLVTMTSLASAVDHLDGRTPVTQDKVMYIGSSPTAAKSDTIVVFGGPGTTEGKFQDVYGFIPDRQGWTGQDNTVSSVNHWQVSDYRAAALDPGTLLNQAWWCGEDFVSCGGADLDGGYGNSYDDQLVWSGAVANAGLDVTVRVTAVLNHDLEIGYDAVELSYMGTSDWVIVWSGDDVADVVAFDETFVVTAAEYQNSNEVSLRWRVRSDGAWSDADCLYPSAGAVQIDLIEVWFDQGTGPISQGIETCQPGDPLLWTPTLPTGVGDFSKVWPMLEDINPCFLNYSPQFAFIDDGVVVPGTGGSLCITWCYGPNGFVVNSTGGLRDATHHLDNSIISPAFDLPGGDYTGHLLSFDVWTHQPIESGMYWSWEVRYSTESSGDTWTQWQDRSFMYYGGPQYRRDEHIVSDLVALGAVRAQVAFTVMELGWIWGIESNDVTPAPYFDNVAYRVFQQEGPMLTARAIDLPLDAFATTLDPANPAAASVRFDAGYLHPGTTTPGDSIVVSAVAMRQGATLIASPELHYRLTRNPIFDPWRSSGLPDEGIVVGDTTRTSGGMIVPDRWTFDLPDSGFLYPGDALRFYITVSTDLGGDIRTTTLPSDTTGYGTSPRDAMFDGAPYPEDFTFRALPSVNDIATMNHPMLLVWADAADDATNDRWFDTLAHVLTRPGDLYDLYVTGDDSDSGLGLRTSSAVLAGYDILIYSGGDRQSNLLTDSRAGTGQEDVQLLESWLALGDKGLMVWGDQVVPDLSNYPAPAGSFAFDELGADLADPVIWTLIDGQVAPGVQAAPTPPFGNAESWFVFGGCPDFDPFAALEPVGDAIVAAEWLNPSGQTGQYPYAAVLYQPDPSGRGRVTVPWDLEDFYDSPSFMYQRSVMLMDLLAHFQFLPFVGIDEDNPQPLRLSITNHPNPFNPATVVTYVTPRPGRVTIDIFDARGGRVRTLLDEVRPAGLAELPWSGCDDAGRSVSSGLYFTRIRFDGETKMQKMLLLR
jgi:hypothetical protein